MREISTPYRCIVHESIRPLLSCAPPCCIALSCTLKCFTEVYDTVLTAVFLLYCQAVHRTILYYNTVLCTVPRAVLRRCKFPTAQGTPSEVLRVLVRERGRFRFFPIHLVGDEEGVTLPAVLGQVRRHYAENKMLPVWAKKRPPMLRTARVLSKPRVCRALHVSCRFVVTQWCANVQCCVVFSM